MEGKHPAAGLPKVLDQRSAVQAAQGKRGNPDLEDAMKTALDNATLDEMEARGGSFIRALAKAARYADDDNLSRIKTVWQDDWLFYQRMIPNLRARFQEAQ
jgi:hypothetical protein